jgi:hypothetical protein
MQGRATRLVLVPADLVVLGSRLLARVVPVTVVLTSNISDDCFLEMGFGVRNLTMPEAYGSSLFASHWMVPRVSSSASDDDRIDSSQLTEWLSSG